MNKRKNIRKKIGGALTEHRDRFGVKRLRHLGRIFITRHGQIHK